MKIAIDARAFSWEGIGRYTRNLLRHLARRNDEHEYIALISRDDKDVFERVRRSSPAGKLTAHVVDGSYYSWREHTMLPWQLRQVQADLFHFTHFNVPLGFKRAYVVTVHDCTRFIFPGQKSQGLLQQVAYEKVFTSAIKRARAVITVSQVTRDELGRLPVKLPKRTDTIYEGVEEDFLQPSSQQRKEQLRVLLGDSRHYLLFVGVWMSHKNLERLIAAFARIAGRYSDLRLVVTGKMKPGLVDVLQLARDYHIEDRVIFPGFVPQDLMPALYQQAQALVFPSLYEGFGLPALEALAAGTPVVASNVTSLPEILGEAAVYVNPESVESIVRGIEKIISDQVLRERLSQAGKERAGLFSWKKCAEEHVKVYESSGDCDLGGI